MRRALLLFCILLVVPAYLFSQENKSNAAGEVAHGSEKAAHEVAHPGEAHGEEHAAPKTYFGIPGWIFKLINVIGFLWLLWYFLKGPIANAIQTRHQNVLGAAQEARTRRTKADQLASDIQARLTQIEIEVREIRERAEAEGERQKKEMIAAAEAEAERILQAARNEVDNRLKHARQELMAYAGELAADRAEQIVRDAITDQDRRKLFGEGVREVGNA